MYTSINESIITELKDLMEDDFSILIETFLTDSDKRMVDLKEAISNSNATEVREIAHGLKGSSSNLGANILSEISFKLETMGRTNELDDALNTYTTLVDEYSKVKSYFENLINV